MTLQDLVALRVGPYPKRRTDRTLACLAESLERRALFAIITVDTLTDAVEPTDGHTSLREALAQADANPGSDTINFAPSLTAARPGRILLSNELMVRGEVTIKGPGADHLAIDGGEGAGNTTPVRVFNVAQGANAAIAGLTITGGYARFDGGGGILNAGTLVVSNADITRNQIDGGGAGISNDGTLTLIGSSVSENSGFDNGGGIANSRTMVIVDSVIRNNRARGARGNGGGIANYTAGTLTLMNTTIARNGCDGDGGGIANFGNLSINQCTVAENAANFAQFAGQVSNGGGLLPSYSPFPGTVYGSTVLQNSIVAGNVVGAIASGQGTPDDIAKGNVDVAQSRSNLIGAAGAGGAGGIQNGVNGNLVGVANPGLAPLNDYNGPTPSYALVAGSPAIDAADPMLLPPDTLDLDGDGDKAEPLPLDQPGRPRVAGDRPDIGAYEFQPTAAPQVIDELIRAASWTSPFIQYLGASQGFPKLGYSLPRDPLGPLPWSGLNQISLRYDRPATPKQSDLELHGVKVPNYVIAGFHYDAATYSASWTLAEPIDVDRLRLVVLGDSTPLDVLPGDVNRTGGAVDATDLVLTRNRIGRSTVKPGISFLPSAYNVFGDVNGDGAIGAVDTVLVRNNIGRQLPAIPAFLFRDLNSPHRHDRNEFDSFA